jgi:hypothetical protein
LKEGGKATLKNRLGQHRGVIKSGGGNHRGSIFRLLVGQALIARDGLVVPTWGCAGEAKEAARGLGIAPAALKESESPVEIQASTIIRDLSFVLVSVPDAPGPSSLRGEIERNSIALVSNYGKATLDPHSASWLGSYSNRERVRASGLWNSNHVDETYNPCFLDKLERCLG